MPETTSSQAAEMLLIYEIVSIYEQIGQTMERTAALRAATDELVKRNKIKRAEAYADGSNFLIEILPQFKSALLNGDAYLEMINDGDSKKFDICCRDEKLREEITHALLSRPLADHLNDIFTYPLPPVSRHGGNQLMKFEAA